jgi:hypothetical protein
MSMWRTGEAPLLSRCSLCPGCFPGRDVQRLHKAGNKGRCRCGGPEKLLDFLDVLFATVGAALGGMYIIFTKGGRCGGTEKLLDLLNILLAKVGAALGGMDRVCTKPGIKVVDVDGREMRLRIAQM